MKKILILSANPINTSKIRLDEEVREIQSALSRNRSREEFQLISQWAVRINDLRRALLDEEPQIVHFSGHGIVTSGDDFNTIHKQTRATEFLIEKMQPDWLKNQFPKIIYSLMVWGVIGSLLNGLIWGCLSFIFYKEFGLIFGLFNGLIIGLLAGIIFGLFSEQLIKVTENQVGKEIFLIKSIKVFSPTTIVGLIVGLISGLTYVIYILAIEYFWGLTNVLDNITLYDVYYVIIIGLIIGVTYGLIGEIIQTIETLKFSLKKSLKSWREWLIIRLLAGLFLKFFIGILDDLNSILKSGMNEISFKYLINHLFNQLYIY